MDSIKKPQEDNDWDLCIERSDASATLAEATGHKSDVEGQGPDASGETENAEKHNEKQQDATQAAESKVAPNLEGTDIGPNVVTAQSGVTSEKPEKIDLPYTRKRKSMTSKTKATWNTRTLELTLSSIRFKLQSLLLRGQPIKKEDMKVASELIKQLEDSQHEVTYRDLRGTGIRKVLTGISELESIPMDENLNIKARCDGLLRRYEAALQRGIKEREAQIRKRSESYVSVGNILWRIDRYFSGREGPPRNENMGEVMTDLSRLKRYLSNYPGQFSVRTEKTLKLIIQHHEIPKESEARVKAKAEEIQTLLKSTRHKEIMPEKEESGHGEYSGAGTNNTSPPRTAATELPALVAHAKQGEAITSVRQASATVGLLGPEPQASTLGHPAEKPLNFEKFFATLLRRPLLQAFGFRPDTYPSVPVSMLIALSSRFTAPQIDQFASDLKLGFNSTLPFFFYGSFIFPAALRAVTTGNTLKDMALSMTPGILRGYRRYAVKGQEWPALLPSADDNDQVHGMVVFGLPDSQRPRIHWFQSGMSDLKRRSVEIELRGGEKMDLDAGVYVWNQGEERLLKDVEYSPSALLSSAWHSRNVGKVAEEEQALKCLV